MNHGVKVNLGFGVNVTMTLNHSETMYPIQVYLFRCSSGEISIFLINFGLNFSRENNFFCYTSSLENRLFPVFPLQYDYKCSFYCVCNYISASN